MVRELDDILAKADVQALSAIERVPFVQTQLTDDHCTVFSKLPEQIQQTLCQDRDSHGNLQVSLIPTEELLMDMLDVRIKERMLRLLGDSSLDPVKRSHLSEFSLKPGAIIKTKDGINISIIKTIKSKLIKSKLNILFANL